MLWRHKGQFAVKLSSATITATDGKEKQVVDVQLLDSGDRIWLSAEAEVEVFEEN